MAISIQVWEDPLASSQVLSASIAFLSALACGDGEGRAKELMSRSIRQSYKVNVMALMSQTDLTTGGEKKIRLIRNTSGMSRNTILLPLRDEGEESLDDGKFLKRYVPRENLVVIQPTNSSDEVNVRYAALLKNYRLSSEPGPVVAGRKTIHVRAIPVDKQKDTVEICFDADHGFPLRRQHGKGKSMETDYEMHQVSYPKKIDKEHFEFSPPPKAEVMELKPRAALKSIKDAEPYVGFQPFEIRNLPLGFQVTTISLTSNPQWKAVSTKISDGLVHMTVYQWQFSEKEKAVTGEVFTSGERGRIRVMIISDAPSWVRREVLGKILSLMEPEPNRVSPRLQLVSGRPGHQFRSSSVGSK